MPTIGHLLRERREPFISLEFFPPSDPAQLPAFYETAERLQALKPLFASVTYGAGGGKQQNTLAVTADLVRRGFSWDEVRAAAARLSEGWELDE